MKDYLTAARQFLEVDTFGQERPPSDVDWAVAYALVDIAESLRKLSDEPNGIPDAPKRKRTRSVTERIQNPITESDWDLYAQHNGRRDV